MSGEENEPNQLGQSNPNRQRIISSNRLTAHLNQFLEGLCRKSLRPLLSRFSKPGSSNAVGVFKTQVSEDLESKEGEKREREREGERWRWRWRESATQEQVECWLWPQGLQRLWPPSSPSLRLQRFAFMVASSLIFWIGSYPVLFHTDIGTWGPDDGGFSDFALIWEIILILRVPIGHLKLDFSYN